MLTHHPKSPNDLRTTNHPQLPRRITRHIQPSRIIKRQSYRPEARIRTLCQVGITHDGDGAPLRIRLHDWTPCVVEEHAA